MKHLKLGTLLLTAALFTGFGATTLSAEMKCGAGKCGKAQEIVKDAVKSNCSDCNSTKKLEKAAAEAKGAMKCGAGKCGSK